MPQRVLALELDAHEVKAAVLETTFRDYRVVGFYRDPLAAANGSLAEQVRGFLQRHQLTADTVLSSLPGDLVTLRTFFLPFRDRRRLDQTVPFELESQVPFSLDDVIIDYHVLHRDRSGSSVLAALVQRRDLEQHLALLTEAGLDPKVVDLAPLATLNVFSLLGSELPETFVYVGGNLRRVTVALYRNRQLVGLRTLVRAAPAMVADSAAAATGNGHPVEEPAELRALIGEIRWTLLAINGAPLDAGLPCLVGGDSPQFDQLAPELAGALQLDVRRLDQAPLRNVPAQLRPDVASFVSPLGLALREVTPNSALGVNFRRGEFAYHRGQEELRHALWRTGAIAAIVLVLMMANTVMSYRQLAARVRLVQEQIQNVFKQTLPDIQRVVDEKSHLQAEVETAQKRLQLLGGLATGATAVDVLRTITVAVPDTLKVDTDEYIMDGDVVRIKAKTDSFEAVDTIKQQLVNTYYFPDVQVKDVKQGQDGKVDFRLVLSLNKEPGGGAGGAPRQ